MEPWLSWAVFIAIVGGAWFYYSQQNTRGRARGRSVLRAPVATTKADPTVQWSDSESTPRSSAKPAKKAQAPRKPVKKAVQEVGEKVEAYLSTASSTAGVDADDDLSPAVSPALGATTTATSPSGRDVSDMLEPKAAGPSVLKINPSEKPGGPDKPQQKREETPQETKKQRQNRKKAEEAKAQREADEKQRRILEEKQRRTAREARGEPAKNGLQQAQVPNNNPWTTVRSSATAARAPAHEGQLLDTFDPDVVSTASSSEAATNGTAPTPDSLSNSTHWTNLPSEEEQLRMAMEDSAWTTVPKGKKQQRKNKAGGEATADEGSDSGVPQEAAPVAPIKPAPAKKENVPRSRFELLSEPTAATSVGHPMDSDWSVA